MSLVEPLAIAPIGTELLDDPAADPVLAAESLRDIIRSNRWFGGAAAVRYGLRRALSAMSPRARRSRCSTSAPAPATSRESARAWASAPRHCDSCRSGSSAAGSRPDLARAGGLPCAVAARARHPSGRSRWTSSW